MGRSVVYAPEAAEDLLQLYSYLAEQSGPERARGYVARLEAHCRSLAEFPERGRRRDDLRLGLRITRFERRALLLRLLQSATLRFGFTLPAAGGLRSGELSYQPQSLEALLPKHGNDQ
jgi:toxin ParE1/3/4